MVDAESHRPAVRPRRGANANAPDVGDDAQIDMGQRGPGGDAIRAAPGSLSRGSTRRLLTTRIPVWATLAIVVVVGGILGAMLVVQAQSSVRLGPAAGAAQQVDASMVLCNEDVDRLRLNPRASELDLEDVFRQAGAAAVDVTVKRIDCPKPPAP